MELLYTGWSRTSVEVAGIPPSHVPRQVFIRNLLY